jgi:hypothetical protein
MPPKLNLVLKFLPSIKVIKAWVLLLPTAPKKLA